MSGQITGDSSVPIPGLLRTFVWGLTVLALSQWVHPSNLTIAALNLGDKAEVWVTWPAWGMILCAPAFELLARRSRALVTLQALSGGLLIAAAALLKMSGRLADAWLPVALAAATGTVVSQMGWARFIEHVPAKKRCGRLFVAMLGVGLVPVLWSGVFTRLSGALHHSMPWTDVWATIIAMVGLLVLAFAGFSCTGSYRTVPQLATRAPLAQVLRGFLHQFFRQRALAWVVIFLLGYAVATGPLVDTVIRHLESDDGATGLPTLSTQLGHTAGLAGFLAFLAYPLTAHFGLKRTFRPIALGTVLAPGLCAVGLVGGTMSQTFATLVLALQLLLGTAFGIAFTLYAMAYVKDRDFVLSRYAWLTALLPVFTFGARSVLGRYALVLGEVGTAGFLLVGVSLALTALFNIPLDEDTLR